ncbi:tripartite tricarboxylate transporter TctB family protein [soil metagenome]
MRLNDALLGFLLIVFAGGLAFASRDFPTVPGQHYGASAFPSLIAVGFAGCGAVLIVSGLRQRMPPVLWLDWARERRGILNVAATIGAVLFYLAAAGTLGFMLTAAPILLVLLRLFGVGWPASIAVAVLVPLGMQYLFGRTLLVPLPWGLLAPYRWW